MLEGQIHGGYLSGDVPGFYTILFNAASKPPDALQLRGTLMLPKRLLPDDPHYQELSVIIHSIIGEFVHPKLKFEIAVRSEGQPYLEQSLHQRADWLQCEISHPAAPPQRFLPHYM